MAQSAAIPVLLLGRLDPSTHRLNRSSNSSASRPPASSSRLLPAGSEVQPLSRLCGMQARDSTAAYQAKDWHWDFIQGRCACRTVVVAVVDEGGVQHGVQHAPHHHRNVRHLRRRAWGNAGPRCNRPIRGQQQQQAQRLRKHAPLARLLQLLGACAGIPLTTLPTFCW